MSVSNTFPRLFEHKQWANDELLALGAVSRSALPAEDFERFVRTLNHVYVVDRIFASHLNGIPQTIYSSTNTEETPTLELLREKIRITDEWYLQYASVLEDFELMEEVEFRFTDGKTGTMSRSEILHHVVIHGAYHRGAAGRILAAEAIQPPCQSIPEFLHQMNPSRRWA